MTALGAATIFPISPDGEFDVTLSRAWSTDIQRTRSGKEVRSALRVRAPRHLDYRITPARSAQFAQFTTLWLTATELLRFAVPVWPDSTDATAFPDAHTITADTTYREFIAGEQAILWLSDTVYELVTIGTLAADHITTVNPIVGSWSSVLPSPVRLVPVMDAWLSPPPKEQATRLVEHVTLAFDEELPAVAGLDSTVGASTTEPGASMTVDTVDHGSTGLPGLRYFTISAFVLDAAGQLIREPNLVWTVTQTGTLPMTDPSFRKSFPKNGQQCHIEYNGDADAGFQITTTYGSLTHNTNIP